MRPDIDKIHSGDELKKWYWLKEELTNFCKMKGIGYTGLKFDILERIANFIDGEIGRKEGSPRTVKPNSDFNWVRSELTLDTVITDNYKNGQNARSFFKRHCGDKFHFSIPLMNFMKNNCGKTLQDAVLEWQRLEHLEKNKNFKSDIPLGNQYNQYIRDFFVDNPNRTIEDARNFWKLKRSLPLTKHKYDRSDLDLK